MAERSPQPSDAELARALRALRPRLGYPPTPPLASAVRRRLAAGPPPPRPFWRAFAPPPRRLALAMLAIATLAGVILGAFPAARATVADRLGLRGIAIVYVTPAPASPPPAATATSTAPAGAATATPPLLGARVGLGQPIALEEARGRVAFPIRLPALPDLAAPDEVYAGAPPPGGQVTLVYRARPGLPPPSTLQTEVGLLITQFRGAIEPELYGKGIGPGTQLEAVTVNGGRGYWIEGRPHTFFYRDADGRVRDESSRLAGNTLLWEQDGLTFRLESALTKEEALRIAAALR